MGGASKFCARYARTSIVSPPGQRHLLTPLGSTKEVQDLDKVRHRIKTHKALQQEYSQHAVLLCHFRQQLEQKRNSNKQALKLFESTYFKTHQKLPNPTENSDYKELLHSSKLVLRLLTYPDFKL